MRTESFPEVTLEAILLARENRAARQRTLLAERPGAALVSLTVNMPGPVKRTPESVRVFEAGFAALRAALPCEGLPVLHVESRMLDTGAEGYLLAAAPAHSVKRVACTLESELPYGRLLDIDVLAPDGKQISRTGLGLPARGCMVCGREGAYCASRRTHPLTELIAAFERIAATVPEEMPL